MMLLLSHQVYQKFLLGPVRRDATDRFDWKDYFGTPYEAYETFFSAVFVGSPEGDGAHEYIAGAHSSGEIRQEFVARFCCWHSGTSPCHAARASFSESQPLEPLGRTEAPPEVTPLQNSLHSDVENGLPLGQHSAPTG